jgi:type IV secretory pathway VirB2 component (pilin)
VISLSSTLSDTRSATEDQQEAKAQAADAAGRPGRDLRTWIATVWLVFGLALTMHAQSPWERAASNLETTFTGALARSLALVAIVIGGLMFMFGEAGAKRQISGIVFGGGLALFATQFLAWLF